jgi:serine/threonine-protein kinase
MAGNPEEPSDPLIGTLIDRRYRVLKRLGDGGMGIVYKVEHTYLNKLFALKVMRPTKDEIDRKRFEQEARLASGIRHPNVVEISDFGLLPTDQPYFVMEFLRGHTLGDAILEDQLDSLVTCLIAAQIASGLQAVHKQNVIHRDLKPDNIFLVDPDDHQAEAPAGRVPGDVTFVKIMDFGIAKSTDNKLTGTGMTVGTPEYMSPEQATGDKVDWRTDQYSMGCILYEMLTGFLPFEGQSAFEIMNKHLNERPVPPRQRRPDRTLEITEGLELIVLRLLEKDRNARYSNMRAVEQALREQATALQRMRLSNQRTLVSPPPRTREPAPADHDGQRTVPLLPALAKAGSPDPAEDAKTIKDLPVVPGPAPGPAPAPAPAPGPGSDLQRERTRVLPAVPQTHELMKKIGDKVRSRPSLPELPRWQRLPVVRFVLKLWYWLRGRFTR